MVDNIPINNSSPLNKPGSIAPAAPSNEGAAAQSTGGLAFRGMLDKLQQQARSLQQDSENVSKPEDLSGAVDRARTSLGDALSLSNRLLEAYRESIQQKGTIQEPGEKGK
ncbi:MAG: flagellar hook-basal body complex protein FliE [Planctomycetota bacterium]|jgi:flagellar hook-basal body complex protein FliE